jgi:hypothetical protein
MKSIKCVSCGLVSWATAEVCKRCGAIINSHEDAVAPSQTSEASADESWSREAPRKTSKRWAKRWAVALGVLALLVLPATWLAVRAFSSQGPQTFVLKDGTRKISNAWFHAWFSSDPSGDEIFDHYLKVSGWHDHSQGLKSYLANGRFEIKNENNETIARMKNDPYRQYVHFHWSTCEGDVELKGEGPDKLLITQNYDEGGRFWQRGTNGGTAWWRKAWRVQDPQTSSPPLTGAEVGDFYSGLAELRRGADFVNYLQLQTRFSGLYLRGKSMVGDRVCYEVRTKPRSGPAEAMYFDVETGLLLKFEPYRREVPYVPLFDEYILLNKEPSSSAETYLERYREVDGVQIPFLIRQHVGDYWVTTTISEFKSNPEIASAEFEKPPK